MSKTTNRLDKFVRRFQQGDLGYCAHRLRKFNRCREEACRAAATVVKGFGASHIDADGGGELFDNVFELKDEMVRRGLIGYQEIADLTFQFGTPEQCRRVVEDAPNGALLALVRSAARLRWDETFDNALDRYVAFQKGRGLANALERTCELAEEFKSSAESLIDANGLVRRLEDNWLAELKGEAAENFAAFLKGCVPTEVAVADDCQVTNEFNGIPFANSGEFADWLRELNADRGPLDVETADGADLLKDGADLAACDGWLHSRVAVVRDASERRSVLFVALVDDDLAGATVRKVWLSCDNRLWDLEFKNPLRKDKPTANAAPAAASRPTRADELAKAIAKWRDDRTDRNFAVAVWAVAVDAAFEKTAFVPTAIGENGNLKAMGPVDADGNRTYVCHVDLPARYDPGCVCYSELQVSAMLKMVLLDKRAAGLAVRLGDTQFLVARECLEDLARKIGTLVKEDGNGNA